MADIRLFAAGSLKAPFREIAKAFERSTGTRVAATFGASGLLCRRLMGGEPADVFAAADLSNPTALADADLAEPPQPFARNWMCALVRAADGIDTTNLLDKLCDDGIRVATSTPGNDPCGDYAWTFFDNAERVRPGAAAHLKAKALRLTGDPASPKAPHGENVYGWFVATAEADVFLTYVTNADAACRARPELARVPLPAGLATAADLHLCVLRGGHPRAQALADFIRGAAGRAVLGRHGFELPADPGPACCEPERRQAGSGLRI